MNFFRRNRYNLIAAFVSIALHVTFVVVLSFKLNKELFSKEDEDNQFELQLQPEQENPLPPQPQQKTEETKKLVEEMMKTIDIPQPDLTDKTENTSQDLGEIPLAEKKDTAVAQAVEKLLEALTTPPPPVEDSIIKKEIQEMQKAKEQILTDKRRKEDDRRFLVDNYRTIRNFKKVYPYAIRTRQVIDSLNKKLATITDNRLKKQMIKQKEKELFNQFEKEVRNMSFSQGKLLLKLIARETDQSAYDLIKTYKGKVPATFWYGVGLLFRENLKMDYDSTGEDALLEKIVVKYKQGKL
ncbi:MAG: DUF4294 domain-containing protein [Bacteroidota bacterium]|nr:DUF4294 domain-containing protein [Bacteroidota bacterium]